MQPTQGSEGHAAKDKDPDRKKSVHVFIIPNAYYIKHM